MLLLFLSANIFAKNNTQVLIMQLTSNAFQNNAFISQQYTCDGSDVSPPLQWHDTPADTKSFVLIVDDPDAPHGTWDHWILFNIPSNTNQLSENISQLPAGTKVGKNSWGKTGYGGPCPPSNIHRYFFKLYALDTILPLKNGVSKQEIILAMKNHILSTTELMGKYERIK